jgi:hypothetical protein
VTDLDTSLPRSTGPAGAPSADPGRTRAPAGSAAAGPAATLLPGAAAAADVLADLRFGPGVPAEAPVGPTAARALRAPRRRRRAALLLTLLLAAGVLWWWSAATPALAVVSVRTPAAAVEVGCGETAVLRATVLTGGGGGELVYRWERSDGTSSPALRQRVAQDQDVVDLALHWTVRGRGRYEGTAVLVVEEPAARRAAASFRYACP